MIRNGTSRHVTLSIVRFSRLSIVSPCKRYFCAFFGSFQSEISDTAPVRQRYPGKPRVASGMLELAGLNDQISPAAILIVRASTVVLKKNERMPWISTMERMSREVVATSAVCEATPMTKEK